MKHKIDIRIFIIIVLAIILGVMLYFYFKNDSNTSNNSRMNIDISSGEYEGITVSDEEAEEITASSTTLVSTTTQVQSALTENLDIHTSYYLEECYVEEGDMVLEGEYILKYTNGTYLTAPYDCVINSINIPDEEEQFTSMHSIEVSSTNLLQVTLSVDESIINEFYLGQDVSFTISALDDEEYPGYITSISNTASNGKFTIVCEFENDGNIRIGMTTSVVIKS